MVKNDSTAGQAGNGVRTRWRRLSCVWKLLAGSSVLAALVTAGATLKAALVNRDAMIEVEDRRQRFSSGGGAGAGADAARPASRGPLLVVAEGEPVEVAPGVAVSLLRVETLKGANKRGSPHLGHAYNRALADREHVFGYMLSHFTDRSLTARQVMEMEQRQWDAFLRAQTRESRERILNTPFATLRASVGGASDASFEGRRFFRGETVAFRGPSGGVECRVAHLFDTRLHLSGQPPTLVLSDCRARA